MTSSRRRQKAERADVEQMQRWRDKRVKGGQRMEKAKGFDYRTRKTDRRQVLFPSILPRVNVFALRVASDEMGKWLTVRLLLYHTGSELIRSERVREFSPRH